MNWIPKKILEKKKKVVDEPTPENIISSPVDNNVDESNRKPYQPKGLIPQHILEKEYKVSTKISKRKDINPKAGIKKYGKDADFADPVNKKYPLRNEKEIRAALSYINMPKNAAKYSPAEVKTIKARIARVWRKKIDPKGPPSMQKKKDEKK